MEFIFIRRKKNREFFGKKKQLKNKTETFFVHRLGPSLRSSVEAHILRFLTFPFDKTLYYIAPKFSPFFSTI